MREWIIILIDCMGSAIALLVVSVTLIVCIWGVLSLVNRFREWGNKYQQRANELAKERQKLLEDAERYGGIWDNYVVKAIVTATIAAAILIGAAIFASKKYEFTISSNDIVLTFVGILATFIVLTNYAQVIDIKRDLHRRITKLEDKRRRFDNLITNSSRFDRQQKRPSDQSKRAQQPIVNKK